MANKNNIESGEEHLLSSVRKENCFSVPDRYFDYLPQEISKKIRTEKSSSLVFRLRPASSFAYFVTLCGIVVVALIHSYRQGSISANNLALSESDIQRIIDHPDNYNINETEITERYLSLNIQDESMAAGIPDEEIKNYLEESSDENTISNNY
ncbi:MAG TPA: hypothetical protein VII99_04590 [Bacteroidia bacterium]